MKRTEIARQQELLRAYRARLDYLLEQATRAGGESFVPTDVLDGVAELREQIQQIKGRLRAAGIVVDDAPDDAPTIQDPSVPMPSGLPLSDEVIGGDKVCGDKIGADKVGRDKISVMGGQGTLITPTGNISQTNVQTDGGDYAEGNIDKRRGVFWDRVRIPLAIIAAVFAVIVLAQIASILASAQAVNEQLQRWHIISTAPPFQQRHLFLRPSNHSCFQLNSLAKPSLW